jgi:membrane-bound lytic murein transglycosylase D
VASAAAKPAGPAAAPTTETYRVRSGDSIWTIARRKGVAAADLLRWNKLTEKSIIRPGDRLVIRYGS